MKGSREKTGKLGSSDTFTKLAISGMECLVLSKSDPYHAAFNFSNSPSFNFSFSIKSISLLIITISPAPNTSGSLSISE